MKAGLKFRSLGLWLAMACALFAAGLAARCDLSYSAGFAEEGAGAANKKPSQTEAPRPVKGYIRNKDYGKSPPPEAGSFIVKINSSEIKKYTDWMAGQIDSGKIQSLGELYYVSQILAAHYAIFESAAPSADSGDFSPFSPHEAQLAQAVWGIISNSSQTEEAAGVSQGTGFFAKLEAESGPARYFVTNFHVIREQLAAGGVFSDKLFLYQDNGEMEIAVIQRVFISALYDLALLEISGRAPGRRGLEIRKEPVSPHELVFSIGYPNRRLRKISQKLPFLSRPQLNLRNGGSVVEFEVQTAAILQGMSGAPVFDQKGRVAAVFESGRPSLAIASASQNILKILSGKAGTDCAYFIDSKTCETKEIQNLERQAAEGHEAAIIQLAFVFKQNGDMEGFKQWLRAAATEQNSRFAQRVLLGYYARSPDPAFGGGGGSFFAALKQVIYWHLRYKLNFLWEARAGRDGAEDWERLMLSP